MIWLGFFAIFCLLAGYITWLYSVMASERHQDRLYVARVVGELRGDVRWLADAVGVDLAPEPEPEQEQLETTELPAWTPPRTGVVGRYGHIGGHRR